MRPYLSASSINAFLNCPRYFAFVYEEEAEPAHVSSNLLLGSAVHLAAAKLYQAIRGKQKIKRREVAAVFCDSLLALKESNPPILFNKDETFGSLLVQGVGLIDCLVENTPRDEEILEVDFEINVPMKNSEGKDLGIGLKCILDKLCRAEGKEIAVDLKTSARKYTSDKTENDIQACAYTYALAARNGGGPQRFQWQVLLKTPTPSMVTYETTLGPRDFDRLWATAENMLRGVQAGAYAPVQSWRCKTCPFSEPCRSWGS